MSQIVERFEAAVEALLADGPVKSRLSKAYTGFLEDLQQVDLPVEGNGDFGALHRALHREVPVGKIGAVTASINKMSPVEAACHARTIVRLYTELLAMERGARIKPEAALELAEEMPPRYRATGR
jgi:hypothetical protein